MLDLSVMPSSETNPQTFDCTLNSASDEQLRVSPSDEQTRDEKKKLKKNSAAPDEETRHCFPTVDDKSRAQHEIRECAIAPSIHEIRKNPNPRY